MKQQHEIKCNENSEKEMWDSDFFEFSLYLISFNFLFHLNILSLGNGWLYLNIIYGDSAMLLMSSYVEVITWLRS